MNRGRDRWWEGQLELWDWSVGEGGHVRRLENVGHQPMARLRLREPSEKTHQDERLDRYKKPSHIQYSYNYTQAVSAVNYEKGIMYMQHAYIDVWCSSTVWLLSTQTRMNICPLSILG